MSFYWSPRGVLQHHKDIEKTEYEINVTIWLTTETTHGRLNSKTPRLQIEQFCLKLNDKVKRFVAAKSSDYMPCALTTFTRYIKCTCTWHFSQRISQGLISIPEHEQHLPKARHQRTKTLIYDVCLNFDTAASSILKPGYHFWMTTRPRLPWKSFQVHGNSQYDVNVKNGGR